MTIIPFKAGCELCGRWSGIFELLCGRAMELPLRGIGGEEGQAVCPERPHSQVFSLHRLTQSI